MAHTQRKKRRAMQPFYINGVAVVRVPEGAPEQERAEVVARARQLAYEWSEHPTFNDYIKYRRRR